MSTTTFTTAQLVAHGKLHISLPVSMAKNTVRRYLEGKVDLNLAIGVLSDYAAQIRETAFALGSLHADIDRPLQLAMEDAVAEIYRLQDQILEHLRSGGQLPAAESAGTAAAASH